MGKVSVIIPIYNTEEYLMECITSLWEQSYNDMEILLINDKSNDKCKQLLETVAAQDDRIKLYHFTERKGVGAARNFGIQKATGDYIYFLDSDDYLPYKTLEMLVGNINNHDMIKGRVEKTNFSKSISIIYKGLSNSKLYTDDKKWKLIRDNSALNILFKKSFILNNNLSFAKEVFTYADLGFAVPAIFYADHVPYLKEAVYFKRKRNDPITNPSLEQIDEEKTIKDFIHIYGHLKDQYKDKDINVFLDKQLLNFYRKKVVTFFKDNARIDNCFHELHNAIKKVNPEIVDRYSWILNKEVRAIKKGDLRKYKKISIRHHFLRQVREGIKTRRKFYILLYRKVFLKLPMKENMVFFESFLGKNYSDSPKYIYEYMMNQNMNFKYVWSFEEKKNVSGNPTQVKRFSLRYYYCLARAKYWVSNSRLPKHLDKRKNNIYLQTWHGTPLKTLVFDMNDIYSADPNYKKNFYDQSRRWDYLSSPNQYSSDIFRRAFLFDEEMLEFGYPRNDILYLKNTDKGILNLKKKMNLPSDKKVVLYAPTWRDDEFYARGKYKFTLQLDLETMQKQLGEDYIILLRMHYFIASQMEISDFEGFVYDFSNYDDIAELYLVSDLLITDYSSVFFDYANLKRPILFYTYDLEKYRDKLRGFYIDIEKEVPGPLVKTTEEVIHAIKNIETVEKEYEDKYEIFYDRFCKWDDGNATEKTVEKVFKK